MGLCYWILLMASSNLTQGLQKRNVWMLVKLKDETGLQEERSEGINRSTDLEIGQEKRQKPIIFKNKINRSQF